MLSTSPTRLQARSTSGDIKKPGSKLPHGVLKHLKKMATDYSLATSSVLVESKSSQMNAKKRLELLKRLSDKNKVSLWLPIRYVEVSKEEKKNNSTAKSHFKYKAYHTWKIYDKKVDLTKRLDDEYLACFVPLQVMEKSVVKKGVYRISMAFINPPWGHRQGDWDERFWNEEEWTNCLLNVSGYSHILVFILVTNSARNIFLLFFSVNQVFLCLGLSQLTFYTVVVLLPEEHVAAMRSYMKKEMGFVSTWTIVWAMTAGDRLPTAGRMTNRVSSIN